MINYINFAYFLDCIKQSIFRVKIGEVKEKETKELVIIKMLSIDLKVWTRYKEQSELHLAYFSKLNIVFAVMLEFINALV